MSTFVLKYNIQKNAESHWYIGNKEDLKKCIIIYSELDTWHQTVVVWLQIVLIGYYVYSLATNGASLLSDIQQ